MAAISVTVSHWAPETHAHSSVPCECCSHFHNRAHSGLDSTSWFSWLPPKVMSCSPLTPAPSTRCTGSVRLAGHPSEDSGESLQGRPSVPSTHSSFQHVMSGAEKMPHCPHTSFLKRKAPDLLRNYVLTTQMSPSSALSCILNTKDLQ